MIMVDAILCLRQIGLDVVVCVLLLSGMWKAAGIARFREGLLYIPHMQPAWTYPLAWLLPPLEILTAIGLLAGVPGSRACAVFLWFAFIAVTSVVLSKGLLLTCHCFGPWQARTYSVKTINENVVLLFLTLAGVNLPGGGDAVLRLGTAGFVLAAYGSAGTLYANIRLIQQSYGRGGL
jgi:hypothetical protein